MSDLGLTRAVTWLGLFGFVSLVGCQGYAPPLSEGPSRPDGVHQSSNQQALASATPNNSARQTPSTSRTARPRTTTASNSASRAGTSLNWTSMAIPTGDLKTSVIKLEKGVPREVRVGQPFDYDIVVTNLTSRQVENVVVSDQISNFKLVSAAPEGSVDKAGALTFALGDLKPGERREIRINGTAEGDGAISSCATCTYSSMLCSSIPVVAPKLRLTKTGPSESLMCDEITYTFEVANAGSGTINNLRIRDELPEGLTAADRRNVIDINVGTLAAGQSRKFTSTVRASKTGTYDNKATATGDGMTADSSLVTTTVRQPALALELTSAETSMIGREIIYKATVKSTGDAPVGNTMLSLNLPGGVTFLRADANATPAAGKMTWNLGSIDPGDSRTVSVTVRATNAGRLAASASVQATCAAAATDECSVNVQGVPDIGTSIQDDTGVRLVGDNHVFKYVVKNQGQVDLTNVTLTAEFSAGLDFVSSTSPVQPRGSGKKLSWNLGTIRPGQQIEFTITAKGVGAGEQGVSTSTKTDQLQQTVDNDEQVTFIDR